MFAGICQQECPGEDSGFRSLKFSPLHLATFFQKKDIVQALLDHPSMVAEIDKGDSNGVSALHIASGMESSEIIQIILDRGADIEKKVAKVLSTWGGWSALHLAANIGNDKNCSVLLNRSAKIDSLGLRENETPLIVACRGGHVSTTELLVSHGARIDVETNPKGGGWDIRTVHTPLTAAALAGHADVVATLLRLGANIHQIPKDSHAQSALHIACKRLHVSVVKVLLEAGANPHAVDGTGSLPIHLIEARPECSDRLEIESMLKAAK